MPVSTSKQVSLNRKPLRGQHATEPGEQWLPLGKPRLLVADKDRAEEPVYFGARAKCDPPVSGTRRPQSPPSRTEPAREANESPPKEIVLAGQIGDSISDATCGPDASSPKRIEHNGAELAPSRDATPAVAEKTAGFEEPAVVVNEATTTRSARSEQAFADARNGLDASRPPTSGRCLGLGPG